VGREELTSWCRILELASIGKTMQNLAHLSSGKHDVCISFCLLYPIALIVLTMQAEELQELFGAQRVKFVFQMHNEVVLVPCGWPHQVVNLALCIKFAFDHVVDEELPRYAQVHRDFICKLARESQPTDYRAWAMGMETALFRAVVDLGAMLWE
jgi:hypothetical protein